ncbi:MAG TPA: hypothetical protein VKT80_04535, partial [Chloroflexota bacterium]|nr:hypothetical protein [Chloroflexota bacterium]
DSITLGGSALKYTEVQSTDIGDPTSASIGNNITATVTLSGSTLDINYSGTDHDVSVAGDASHNFTLNLGADDVVTLGDSTHSLDFTQIPSTNFVIVGGNSSVEFKGAVTDTGADISVSAASITVDQGGSISANTIELQAQASSATTITASSGDTSEVINAANTNLKAAIDVEGSLTATSSLTVTSTVTVDDVVNSTNDSHLDAITINANDTSTVTFGASSIVSAATIDAEANTSVTATINATGIGTSVLAAYTPIQNAPIVPAVEVEINVTNVTTVTVMSGASLTASGTGTVSSPDTLILAASDSTIATTNLALTDPVSLPVVGNVLVFSALDSQDNLSRTTSVSVGSGSILPAANAADTLQAAGGDIALGASSSGNISNSETSKALGTVEINAGGSNGDSTSVDLDGVNVAAEGLALTTLSATNYAVSGHLSSVTVGGETETLLDYDNINLTGSDGLVVSAEDDSTLSATSVAPDFDPTTTTENGSTTSGTAISISRTTSMISFDKDIIGRITHASVTSVGAVRVQAVDNTSLSSDAAIAADVATSGGVAVSGGGTLATNSVLGAVSASIESSTVVTTGATGDIQILAGDTSSVTSRAETSASSSGSSTAVGVAATLALNSIGWTSTGLLGATIGTLLGSSSFWTEAATNVTAKITDSTVGAAGALVVKALANGIVASTVTNVSQATATANGDAKAAAVGGVAASNRVGRAATAFLSNVLPPSGQKLAVGAATIDAENNSSISSTSKLVTAAVATSAGAKTTYKSTDDPGNANENNLQLTSTENANLQTTTQLKFGDTVLFEANYNTANLFGINTPKMVTIKTGDTVEVSPNYTPGKGTQDAVYVYTGPITTIDLEQQDYTTGPWTQVNALNNTVYKFMGPSDTNVDLATGALYDDKGDAITTVTPGYFDLGYWYPVPSAQLQPSTDKNGNSTSGSASGGAVGGIVVLNEVDGGANATVVNSTVSGASLSVTAIDSAKISATIDATATSSSSTSGGSSFGSSQDSSSSTTSTSLAVNASIAINEILGDADAHITD